MKNYEKAILKNKIKNLSTLRFLATILIAGIGFGLIATGKPINGVIAVVLALVAYNFNNTYINHLRLKIQEE